jgi:riboflavin synthase
MFTGIIEAPRPIAAVRTRADGGLDLDVDLGPIANGAVLGDSIAVAGVCLTVAKLSGVVATFELSPETLSRTKFGTLRAGARANVERALALGDRLGGHWVQGHVDGLGSVAAIRAHGEWTDLTVEIPSALARYCVEKGSIAVDGVSLTIAMLAMRSNNLETNDNSQPNNSDAATFALVPHTLERTTLGELRSGDAVHLEADILAKHVERLLAPRLPRG